MSLSSGFRTSQNSPGSLSHPAHRSCLVGLLWALLFWEAGSCLCDHPAPLPRMTSPVGRGRKKVTVGAGRPHPATQTSWPFSFKGWLLAKKHWQYKPELFLHTQKRPRQTTLVQYLTVSTEPTRCCSAGFLPALHSSWSQWLPARWWVATRPQVCLSVRHPSALKVSAGSV